MAKNTTSIRISIMKNLILCPSPIGKRKKMVPRKVTMTPAGTNMKTNKEKFFLSTSTLNSNFVCLPLTLSDYLISVTSESPNSQTMFSN
jgi:hypothetical protein